MSKLLGLLMKKHFKFPCFGSTLKVCIASIVLTLATSLACFGGGGGGGGGWSMPPEEEEWLEHLNATNDTRGNLMDDPLVIDLKGIKDPLERNIKTAWRGWKPSNMTQKKWNDWYKKYLKENAKNGEVPWKQKRNKKGEPDEFDGPFAPGQPGGPDFSAERGPGSGWPNLPGWADLGVGNRGTPVPPWAYVPKNLGKPSICYLAPLEGVCLGMGTKPTPVDRWGYNPYVNDCQKYVWSTCGGTRNKFVTKAACDKHCGQLPPPSCSADSGILDKTNSNFDLP